MVALSLNAHELTPSPAGNIPAQTIKVWMCIGHNGCVCILAKLGARKGRRDMGDVLDVAIRPETFGGVIVAPVEQRVEGFENKRLVLLWCGLGRGSLLLLRVRPRSAMGTARGGS
jgi:hypothetical protein